jgi:hypothetical protein
MIDVALWTVAIVAILYVVARLALALWLPD